MNENNNTLSVSKLTNIIKNLLEDTLGVVTVEGELSNYKQHSSGHRYFTLKDDSAQISGVMWRTRPINFDPADGMMVRIQGVVSVYPARGNYQIDCLTMEYKLDKGKLFEEFEKLKAELNEKGYFDRSNKKTIARLPMAIGVSTSPTGAAVRDIFSTINRRFPACKIYFRPTLVQGVGSKEDISAAIAELSSKAVDVIIIGRGGGSIEDLWAYNTIEVANAIHNCSIPIISAVGHETDFTIADFVADVRAATPTAAAELVTPLTKYDLLDSLNSDYSFLERKMLNVINSIKDGIKDYSPEKMQNRIISNIKQTSQKLDDIHNSITKTVNYEIMSYKKQTNGYETLIKSLSPKRPLEKGYALIKSDGQYVNNNMSLKHHKKAYLIRLNESAEVSIKKILPESMFD